MSETKVFKNTIQKIQIRGARVHNLKNVNVDVPLNQIVAIAGVSGSRKVFPGFRRIVCRRFQTLSGVSFYLYKTAHDSGI